MSIDDVVVDAWVRDRAPRAESAWTVEHLERRSTLKRIDDAARQCKADREVFSLMRNVNESAVRNPVRQRSLRGDVELQYRCPGLEPIRGEDLEDARASTATFRRAPLACNAS
ncbi:hypothetical protein [Burkholderia pyrrocinia]|uniref:hypothetical protein n=1 Tax=Burkholderia pyrrocinia TaxID=60550 RepID=UPI00158A3EB2|nr:hypothetical protein [Burkholderia pyrrocinia]